MKWAIILLGLLLIIGCTTGNVTVDTTGDAAANVEAAVNNDDDIQITTEASIEDGKEQENDTVIIVGDEQEPEIIIGEEEKDNDTEYEPVEEELTGEVVEIYATSVEPDELTIKVGTTVTWKNLDSTRGINSKHLIQGHYGAFRSPMLLSGDEFSYKFTEPGEYTYIDVIMKEYIRGTIIVEE